MRKALALVFLVLASPAARADIAAADPAVHASQLAAIMDKFAEERDRRYMDMFKGLTDLVNQRFSDQAVAVAAAFAANEKAIQAAFAANEKATAAALASAKEAVQKAEISADKRFESVNEFRGQLKDQAASFLPRTEYAAEILALHARLDTTDTELARMMGAVLLIAALAPMVTGVVVLFVTRRFPIKKVPEERV